MKLNFNTHYTIGGGVLFLLVMGIALLQYVQLQKYFKQEGNQILLKSKNEYQAENSKPQNTQRQKEQEMQRKLRDPRLQLQLDPATWKMKEMPEDFRQEILRNWGIDTNQPAQESTRKPPQNAVSVTKVTREMLAFNQKQQKSSNIERGGEFKVQAIFVGEKNLCVINNHTLAEGEELSMQVGGKTKKVRCLQIQPNAVRVQVEGAEKTLQAGKT